MGIGSCCAGGCCALVLKNFGACVTSTANTATVASEPTIMYNPRGDELAFAGGVGIAAGPGPCAGA